METVSKHGKNTYQVTCTFDEPGNGSGRDAIHRLLEAIGSLHDDGVEIIHAESTIRSDRHGTVTAMEAKIDAPTQGRVGRLACRAGLPASGIRKIDLES